MTEKFCAGKDYFLKENVSGKESCECKFRFQIGKDKLNFIFDVTDPDIISPYSSDNENIYYGDAVEIFITPDGDLSRYKELEVSPFGVRFFGNIINRDGKTPELTKIAPAFSAQAMETLTGYRVVIDLPLPYGIDIKSAKEIILKGVSDYVHVVQTPAPSVVLNGYGESSLNFSVRAWTPTENYWDTLYDLYEIIFNRLRENGIEIPYNKLDVNIISNVSEQKKEISHGADEV